MGRVEQVLKLVGYGRMRGAVVNPWCGQGLVFFWCEESKLWQEVVGDRAEGSTKLVLWGR